MGLIAMGLSAGLPSGSLCLRLSGWTGMPWSKLPFESEFRGGCLRLCVASLQIKTGRDPRGAELEEEAQWGEVGIAGAPREEQAEMTDTCPRLSRHHNYLFRHSPFS